MAGSDRKWPLRAAYSTAGAAVAALPLLAGPCSGACTSCWRCAAGVSGVLAILVTGKLARKIRVPSRT